MSLDVHEVIRQQNPHYTFAQALAEGISLRDRLMACYLRLRDRLVQHDPDLLTHLRVGERVTTGNLDFGAGNLRYLNPNSQAADFPRSDKPCTGDPAPVPVRFFAWWWDHLTP